MPWQRKRREGSRRSWIPLRSIGSSLLVAGFVSAIAGFFLRDRDASAIAGRLADISIAFGSLIFWIGKRANAEKYIHLDSRPPVLYLRSFQAELEWFALIRYKPFNYYDPHPDVRHVNLCTPTLEAFFYALFDRYLGRMIALGRPEDYLPPTLLASRKYVADDDWQTELAALAKSSRCIIVTPSLTANLHWEFAHLLQESLQTKFFVLTRPDISPKSRRLGDRLMDFLITRVAPKRAKRPMNVPWEDFAQNLRDAGYVMDIAVPGPGSVVGFDANGNAVLINSGNVNAATYTAAILYWLKHCAAPAPQAG